MGMGGAVHVTLGGLSDSQASQGLGVIGKPEKLKPRWVGEFLVCVFLFLKGTAHFIYIKPCLTRW